MSGDQPVLDDNTIDESDTVESVAVPVHAGQLPRHIYDHLRVPGNDIAVLDGLGHPAKSLSRRLDLGFQVRESSTTRKDDLYVRSQALRCSREIPILYQAQKSGCGANCCLGGVDVGQPSERPTTDWSMAWIISGFGVRGRG